MIFEMILLFKYTNSYAVLIHVYFVRIYILQFFVRVFFVSCTSPRTQCGVRGVFRVADITHTHTLSLPYPSIPRVVSSCLSSTHTHILYHNFSRRLFLFYMITRRADLL